MRASFAVLIIVSACLHLAVGSKEPSALTCNPNSKTAFYTMLYFDYLQSHSAECFKLDIVAPCRSPTLTLSVVISRLGPFLDEFFDYLGNLDYPKHRIDLIVYSTELGHAATVLQFLELYKDQYRNTTIVLKNFDSEPWARSARDDAIELALCRRTDYLLLLETDARLTNATTLQWLIEQNQPVIAPMLTWKQENDRPGNFRAQNQTKIRDHGIIGVWEATCISKAVLVKRSQLSSLPNAFSFNMTVHPRSSFCKFCKHQKVPLAVDNTRNYGYLIYIDYYETVHLHNDLYDLGYNPEEWRRLYMHRDFEQYENGTKTVSQPCKEVAYFPLFSQRFCNELLDEVAKYGVWTKGASNRLRYRIDDDDFVPNAALDMRTTGLQFDDHIQYVVSEFVENVRPQVIDVDFFGVDIVHSYIVKFGAGEFDRLDLHDDNADYVVLVDLGRRGIDYEGGGTNFPEMNCQATISQPGWALLFPQELSGMHDNEELPTTAGERFVLIAFAEPQVDEDDDQDDTDAFDRAFASFL